MSSVIDVAIGLCVIGAALGGVVMITCRRTMTGILGTGVVGVFVAAALAFEGAWWLAVGQLAATGVVVAVITAIAWVSVPRGRTSDAAGDWELPPARAALFGAAWVAVAIAIVVLGRDGTQPLPPVVVAPWPVYVALAGAMLFAAVLAFVQFAGSEEADG